MQTEAPYEIAFYPAAVATQGNDTGWAAVAHVATGPDADDPVAVCAYYAVATGYGDTPRAALADLAARLEADAE